MRRPVDLRSKRSGFTLMEVLLVLAIIGVILAMVVPQLMGRRRVANVQASYASIKSLEQALELYQLDHNDKFPQTNEGLQVLLVPNGNDPQWKGPYLKNANALPVDAWNNPIQYQYPGTKSNDDKPDIWSWGIDQQDGTDDDIGNWMPPPQ